jgi:hypothetical protein
LGAIKQFLDLVWVFSIWQKGSAMLHRGPVVTVAAAI